MRISLPILVGLFIICLASLSAEVDPPYAFFSGIMSADTKEVSANAVLGFRQNGDNLDWEASLGLYNSGQVNNVSLRRFWAQAIIYGTVFLKFGYFPESASIAGLFPQLNPFQASLLSDQLRWGGELEKQSDFFAQFRFVAGAFSIKGSFAPFDPPWLVMSLDDPFFPVHSIPQEADLGAFLGIYTLNQARIEAAPWKPFIARTKAETAVELAWQGEGFDLRLLYFNGADRRTTLIPSSSINLYPYHTYDFMLKPVRSDIQLLGAGLSLPINELSLYAESSYVWGRLNLVEEFSASGLVFSMKTIEAEELGVTAGALWSLPWLPVRLMSEMKTGWILKAAEKTITPTLSRLLSGGALVSLFSGRLELSPLTIISLTDGSGAILTKAEWKLRDEYSLWILGLAFSGDPETEFGQFGSKPFFRLGFDWSL